MEIKSRDRINHILDVLNILLKQPTLRKNLDEVARLCFISPSQLHGLFIDFSGIGPRDFLRYTSLEYSSSILEGKKSQMSLFGNQFAELTNISEPKISITQINEEESQSEFEINYSTFESIYGPLFVASTPKGVCYMVFYKNEKKEIEFLKKDFPNAVIKESKDEHQKLAVQAVNHIEKSKNLAINLHLKGTDFQILVWKELLKVNIGSLASYREIANNIGSPRSARAVGTAIGNNPVTYLVPCHRIVRSSGDYGKYMWGSARKLAMIAREAVLTRNLGATGIQ